MVYWFTLVCLVAHGGSILSCQCTLLGINANNSSNKRLYWYAILFHFLILMGCSQCMLKDPKILLLDEATSALDAEGEHIVQDALDQVMVSRTTIVVAHRLSTIKGADMIVVMKDGEVAEKGKHEYLVGKGGVYASLVELHSKSA